MAVVYARSAGSTRKVNEFITNQKRMELAKKAMANATFILARKTPGTQDDDQPGKPQYIYEVVHRYPYHLLCKHSDSGLMESFTMADILTGWVKCI